MTSTETTSVPRSGDGLRTDSPGSFRTVAAAVASGLAAMAVVAIGVRLASGDPRALSVAMVPPTAVICLVLGLRQMETFVVTLVVVRSSIEIFTLPEVGRLGPSVGAPPPIDPAGVANLAIAALGAIWLLIAWRDGRLLRPCATSWALVALAAAAALSTFSAVSPSATAVASVKVISVVTAILVIEQLVRSDPDVVTRLARAVLWSAVVPILVAAQQLVTGASAVVEAGLEDRVRATFLHPNSFGTWAVIVLLVAAHRWSIETRAGRIGIAVLATSLGFLLIMSGARGPWIALLVGALVYSARRVRSLGVLVGVATVGFVVLAGPISSRFGDLSVDRYEDAPDNSLAWRFEYWDQLLGLDHSPLTGFGLGGVEELPAAVTGFRDIYVGRAPHNSYLQVWLETGMIGTVALVALVVTIVLGLVRSYGRAPLGAVAHAAAQLTAFGLQWFTENLVVSPIHWLYLAAACGYPLLSASGRAEPAPTSPLSHHSVVARDRPRSRP